MRFKVLQTPEIFLLSFSWMESFMGIYEGCKQGLSALTTRHILCEQRSLAAMSGHEQPRCFQPLWYLHAL